MTEPELGLTFLSSLKLSTELCCITRTKGVKSELVKLFRYPGGNEGTEISIRRVIYIKEKVGAVENNPGDSDSKERKWEKTVKLLVQIPAIEGE